MSKLNQRLTGIAAACLVVVGGIAFAQQSDADKGGTGSDTQQGALQRPAQPADLPPATTSTTTTSTDTTTPSSSTPTYSTPSSSSTTTTTTTAPSSSGMSSSDTAPAPRSDRG